MVDILDFPRKRKQHKITRDTIYTYIHTGISIQCSCFVKIAPFLRKLCIWRNVRFMYMTPQRPFLKSFPLYFLRDRFQDKPKLIIIQVIDEKSGQNFDKNSKWLPQLPCLIFDEIENYIKMSLYIQRTTCTNFHANSTALKIRYYDATATILKIVDILFKNGKYSR